MTCSPLFLGGLALGLGVSVVLSLGGLVGQVAIGLGFLVSAGLLARAWLPVSLTTPSEVANHPSTSTSTEIPDLIKGLSSGRG